MNIQQWLGQKGYRIQSVNLNGMLNLSIIKGDKRIVNITAPPNIPISPQEFDIQLQNLIKNQVELYEEGVHERENEEKRKDSDSNQKSEVVCISAEESSTVS